MLLLTAKTALLISTTVITDITIVKIKNSMGDHCIIMIRKKI